jgi:hypothetical protein
MIIADSDEDMPALRSDDDDDDFSFTPDDSSVTLEQATSIPRSATRAVEAANERYNNALLRSVQASFVWSDSDEMSMEEFGVEDMFEEPNQSVISPDTVIENCLIADTGYSLQEWRALQRYHGHHLNGASSAGLPVQGICSVIYADDEAIIPSIPTPAAWTRYRVMTRSQLERVQAAQSRELRAMLGTGVKRDHACCTSESDGEEKTECEQLIEFKTDDEEVSDRSVRGRPSRQRISAPERILGSSVDTERANSTEVISGGRTASPDIRAPVSDAQLLHPLTALSSPAAVETTPVRIVFSLVEPGLLFGIDAGALDSNFMPGEFQSIIYNNNDQTLRIRDAATGRILRCHIEDQSVETLREVRVELANYYLRRHALQ